MTDDFQNSFIVRVLKSEDESLAKMLRRLCVAEMAHWARRENGIWLEWDDLDAQVHGPKVWRVSLDWHARNEAAEVVLGQVGLVHPDVPEPEEQLRALEEAGKEDTVVYAKVKFSRDYLRTPMTVAEERRDDGDDDGGQRVPV